MAISESDRGALIWSAQDISDQVIDTHSGDGGGVLKIEGFEAAPRRSMGLDVERPFQTIASLRRIPHESFQNRRQHPPRHAQRPPGL